MKLSEAVRMYVNLREQKAALKREYETNAAALTEKMDAIELKLLELFNKTGMDSAKTEFGTAYTSTRTTATVSDREAFMEFVRTREEWELLEVRAAKGAVEQYMAANDDQLPPGVNLRQERVVNIRQSA